MIVAVRPAAEEPLPLVYIPIDAACSTNFKNCDLAVEGSPISKRLMSPLSFVLSVRFFLEPPNNKQAIAFLISSDP